jgi:peptidoglycan-N-acetylglucosamine deacetylase
MMCFRALVFIFAFFFLQSAYAAKCSFDMPDSFLSRVVAIDSAQGAVYRTAKEGESEKTNPSPLELRTKEAVLVFNEGPHADYTGYILDILDQHCAKAVFFVSPGASLANQDALRDIAQRGHTLALAASPNEVSQAGIERGFAAIAKSSGAPVAPFIYVTGRAEMAAYFEARGISLWCADLDAQDTEPGLTPTQLANRTLLKIREMGKGVIQFHDTRKVTVDGLDSILTGLRLSGFKVVQPVPAVSFAPKDEYLAQLAQKQARPQAPPARTSRKLLAEARRRVLLSERRDPDGRRQPRHRENAN